MKALRGSQMKFGIYPNLCKKNLSDNLHNLIRILSEKNLSYSLPVTMKEGLVEAGFNNEIFETVEQMGKRNIILSVGGDGSFLGAARVFKDYSINMAGIHLGELGFLNSITVDDMEDRIDQIIAGKYDTEARIYLASDIIKDNGDVIHLPDVLNDVVIGHDQIGQLARIKLFINQHFIQEYAADGLIISSPTGSTGYSLSCGGPVLGPSDDEMIVVPVCAHTLQRFAMVLKKDDIIEITVPEREKTLAISLDGSYSYPFQYGDRLSIKAAHKPIRFIRFKDQNFFGTITRKLVRKIVDN